jgi:hypothetical protein
MKVCPIPIECLTGTIDNFENSSTIEGNIYREAFGDNTLRFASHEEICMIEGFI